ncbi:MAG: Fe2+-dependent dioxygenase [Erythrobacter sp.]|uniref:Fe2+-dependent dioxygenase n=1 Tax=Erythrobacter sp. TaxID=1042 RepID=UPI0026061FD0|nr:Fe2+-dependent dioxygenase [Erythrobacter sp.]MDJ0979654.1 Fe2+-dependent dioxygenase [Erythrobacter sp.]
MIVKIAAFTEDERIATLKDRLAALRWRDGRETAGAVAKRVKRNLQAIVNDEAGRAIRAELGPLISENRVVKAAARPRRISPLLISKTSDGGHYGPHVDNSLMGKGANRIRTDISFTLFLSNSADYEGGELVIHTAGLTQVVKGDWGQLVLYPSTSIHEVKPVTKGERVVCVGWIESLIPDPTQRELLFDMENLRTSLRQKLDLGSAELLTLDKTMSNLVRMWSQT